MPIYEYQCLKCGSFELVQRITDSPLTQCPTCRRKVNKLISKSSFHLKGTGWYVTDYAKKGGERKHDDAQATGSDSAAKSDTSATQASGSASDSTNTSSKTSDSSTKSSTTTKSPAKKKGKGTAGSEAA